MDLTVVPKTHNMLSEHLHKINKFNINFSDSKISSFIMAFPFQALSQLVLKLVSK